MINDLLTLKELPPGEYTLSLSVFIKGNAKRIYCYAEGDSEKSENVHLVGFDEFERHGLNGPWIKRTDDRQRL